MSKGLSQMDGRERSKAIERRLAQSESVRGLGYWGAKDAKERQKEEAKKGEDNG